MDASQFQKIIIFHKLTKSPKRGNGEPTVEIFFKDYLFRKMYKIVSEKNNGNSFETIPCHGYFLL